MGTRVVADGDAGAVTITSSESDIHLGNGLSYNLQWSQLMGSTSIHILIVEQLAATSGRSDEMGLSLRGLLELNLMWLLTGRDVECDICDFPWTLLGVSIAVSTVITTDQAASSTVCGWTTAGTIYSVIEYFFSLSRIELAASPHPGCVISSSFICLCRKCSNRCCTTLDIEPITQLGSSTLQNLRNWWSSSWSSLCSPSSWSSELARSLRLTPMMFNISSNVVSGFVVVNAAFLAFLMSSCFYLIAVSASSTHFLATVVPLSA